MLDKCTKDAFNYSRCHYDKCIVAQRLHVQQAMDRRYAPSQIPKLFIYYTLPFPHCVYIYKWQTKWCIWRSHLCPLKLICHIKDVFFFGCGFLAPKDFIIIWLWNSLDLGVLDEGYSRNVSCALNLIATFLFLASERHFWHNRSINTLLYITSSLNIQHKNNEQRILRMLE
jgi:hypothetical protein